LICRQSLIFVIKTNYFHTFAQSKCGLFRNSYDEFQLKNGPYVFLFSEEFMMISEVMESS